MKLNKYIPIIILLLGVVLLNFVSAAVVRDVNGVAFSQTGGPNNLKVATILIANRELYIINFSIPQNVGAGTEAQKCYIYQADNNVVILASGTITNLDCTLNQSVKMLGGQNFSIAIDNSTFNYNWKYNSSGATAIANTNVNWTAKSWTVEQDGSNFIYYTNIFEGFTQITTTDTFSSDLNVTLESPTNNMGFVGYQLFNASVNPTTANITNATIFVWFTNGTLVNQTTTNILTGSAKNYTTWNLTFGVNSNYKWNVLGCGTNSTATICKFATINFTFITGIIENSQIFNATTSSGNLEHFLINITYDSAQYTSVTANLLYNNTAYSGTKIGSGNTVLYDTSVTIPSVLTSTVKNFYWTFIFTNSSGSGFTFNSTSNSQTISSLGIDNCAVNNNTILNFSLYDEDDRTGLNGTIEVIANIYTFGTSDLILTFNSSFVYNQHSPNARVCISNLNQTYTLNYQTKYFSNTSNYQVEYKYGQGITLSSATVPQNIKLYDLLTSRSTAFVINVQGSDLSNIANVVVDVQRQYLPINQFLSVESPITDNSGTTVAHLVAKEIVYNFIVSQNGAILGTFNNYIVKCQSESTGDCRVQLNLISSSATISDYKTYGSLSINQNLNSITRSLQLNYLSSDGLVHVVKLNVIKNDGYGNNTICSNTQSGTSGSFVCSIPNSYGNSSIITELYSDGYFVGRDFLSLGDASSNIFGGARVLIGMLMYSTVVLLMIGHPITIIIGAVLGIGLAGSFHLIDGGTLLGNASILTWFIIAGGIIVFYITKKT